MTVTPYISYAISKDYIHIFQLKSKNIVNIYYFMPVSLQITLQHSTRNITSAIQSLETVGIRLNRNAVLKPLAMVNAV